MQFDEFKKYVAENIKTYLPQEYENASVSVRQATKNNNISLSALCIVGEHKTAPNIYLEQFYVHYLFGMPMEDVMECIADVYLNSFRPDINITAENFTYEKLKVDCQHFFRQIFLGYFSDIVQAFDTLRKNVCGDDYTSLHNPIVLSSVLPAYGMFHSIQILFL